MTIDIISAHDRQPELLELFKEYAKMARSQYGLADAVSGIS